MSKPVRRPGAPRATPMVTIYKPGVLTDREAIQAAIRAEGCTCKATVRIEGIHAHVEHDAWCPILRKQDVN